MGYHRFGIGTGAGGQLGGGLQPVLAAGYQNAQLAQALALVGVVGAAQGAQEAAGFVEHGLGPTQLHGRKPDGPAAEPGLAVVVAGCAQQLLGLHFQPRKIDPEAGRGPHAQRPPEPGVVLGHLGVGGQYQHLPAAALGQGGRKQGAAEVAGTRAEGFAATEPEAAVGQRLQLHPVVGFGVPDAEQAAGAGVGGPGLHLRRPPEAPDELQRVGMALVYPAYGQVAPPDVAQGAEQLVGMSSFVEAAAAQRGGQRGREQAGLAQPVEFLAREVAFNIGVGGLREQARGQGRGYGGGQGRSGGGRRGGGRSG